MVTPNACLPRDAMASGLWASILIQYSAPRNAVWTPFDAARDHCPMCGRYVAPDEAAMERAYDLTARQWQAWMGEAYRPSYSAARSQRVPVSRVIRQVRASVGSIRCAGV